MKDTKRVTKVMVIAVIAMFALTAVSIIPSDIDADDSIEIKDGNGHYITLSSPAEHVVAVGKGASATVIQLGGLDKIVVTDKYSNTATESVYDGLKQRVTDGKATAGGSMYSSGTAQLTTEIVDAVGLNRFDKDTDVIILTGGTDSTTVSMYDDLKSKGFKNILTWTSITTYDQIISFVDSTSKALTGGTSDKVKEMENVRDTIKNKLEKEGITEEMKHKCFYVTWSSSMFKVGNEGSLGTSLLQAAGGNVVTINKDINTTTYNTSLPGIIDTYGKDIVIAADNSIVTNGKSDDLKTQVGTDENTQIIPMESLWNNYDVESMTGVWTLACAMYPGYFSGDVPSLPTSETNDNSIFIMLGVGAVAAVIIIGVFILVMKRH